MHGVLTPIAFSVAIGASLLGMFIAMLVAMRSAIADAARRGIAVPVLFGVAWLLIVLTVVAATRIALWGMAYVGLLKGALLLMAGFAAAGTAVGLMRGLRGGRAITTQGA